MIMRRRTMSRIGRRRGPAGSGDGDPDPGGRDPGSALRMTVRPQAGPGAVAGFGVRLGAFVVDSVVAIVIAVIATGPPPGTAYNVVVYAAFLAIELVFLTLAGQTPGMRLVGAAVMSAADASKPRLRWVAVRTVLLAAVVPALITDATGRAMHDRAAGTVTVRTR
jgi:uncharacterized RDD family membrane protein YckC